MSILIKGMKMPKECSECYLEERDTCRLLKANVSGWGRMLNCPLIELPDHGDLIDRDALMPKGEEKGLRLMAIGIEKIVNAPTVIPAERSEE